jgi:hypothetical protein
LVCAFTLLFGVAVFSYMMGIFIEILDEFKALNQVIDQGEKLQLFFSLMKKLNGGK